MSNKFKQSLLIALITATINACAKSSLGCPQNYSEYTMQKGDELRFIAERYGLTDWTLIKSPKNQLPYTNEQAQKLQEGNIICIPNKSL